MSTERKIVGKLIVESLNLNGLSGGGAISFLSLDIDGNVVSGVTSTTSFLKKVSYTDDSAGNFVLDNPIEKGSIQVYVSGVLKEEGVDYIVKGPNGGEISTSDKIYYVRNSGLTGGTVIIYGVYDVPYNGHLDGELGGA